MSKLLGKFLLELSGDKLISCVVTRLKKMKIAGEKGEKCNIYEFVLCKIEEDKSTPTHEKVRINEKVLDLLFQIEKRKKNLAWMKENYVGYRYVPFKEINKWKEVRKDEIEYIALYLGGEDKKRLIANDYFESDFEFDEVCKILEEFCLSKSLIKRLVPGASKELSKRKEEGRCGRKKGAVGKGKEKRVWSEIDTSYGYVTKESKEEALERIKHNKKVAVLKGYAAWYLDACEEECFVLGKVYEKEKCLKEYKEYRKMGMYKEE